MRNSGIVAALAATSLMLGAPDAARAQGTFEGVIAYQMTVGDMTVNMEQTVKGTRIRQEMQGPMGPMVSLIDVESMDMTVMIPAQKMYMKMNAGQMMEQVQRMQQQNSAVQPDPADFQATGRTETIAGETCEHYTWSSEEGEMDLCIATGLGFMPFASPQSGMGGGGMGGAVNPFADVDKWRARFGDGFVPLAMSVTDKGSTVTMRATRVEPGSVPDSAFEVPSDYTEMRMPGGG